MSQISAWFGPTILVIFFATYALVFAEERLHLRKSKPVMVAAGLIWILVAIAFHKDGHSPKIIGALRDTLLQYCELFLFLLSAMSFVNAMVERNVFEVMRTRLTRMRLSARGIYWTTGIIAFFLSPFADNLTTALVMGTVAISSLRDDRKAIVSALINIVIAANAGGAFSPFGDITTLMIWQNGYVAFGQFFTLFLPALISWLIPAAIISLAVPSGSVATESQPRELRKGAYVVIGLFLFTVAATIFLDHSLHLPPYLGMMTGLGILNFYSYFLHAAEARILANDTTNGDDGNDTYKPFDIFGILEKVEWDTLLFFYGIMFCIGGIGAIGYLEGLSRFLYTGLGNTTANILVGLFSAVVDNIPLVFAVLTMHPSMDIGQWLLVTLAAGIGGSLLSIGSAAGVALMGVGRGTYTFVSHLKWSWAILIGYLGGIAAHMFLNRAMFGR